MCTNIFLPDLSRMLKYDLVPYELFVRVAEVVRLAICHHLEQLNHFEMFHPQQMRIRNHHLRVPGLQLAIAVCQIRLE